MTDRIKHGRVVHCKREPYDVLIDRRSEFGNPHKMRSEAERQEVIRLFEQTARKRLAVDFWWAEKVKALHGKVLGCWCAPKACHGDVLLKLAAELNTPREAMKAHGGTTDAGANGVPTPGSFAGLENREEVIAKPCTYTEPKA